MIRSGTAVARATPAPKRPKPFLKWAGGKTQLLEQFAPLLPKKFGKYFEPFVGGGALFFSLRPTRAQLTDINAELIDCYAAIRDDVAGVMQALDSHHYDKTHYYQVREVDPASLSGPQRAARTIFLNKTSFNGLYRVNLSGGFNVPFGRHRNPEICDEDNLIACSAALRGVELDVADFGRVVGFARPGDFVYFDPPYMPVSATAYFTGYAPGGFGLAEQQKLSRVFRELDQCGVRVMLSNSDVPLLRELYQGYRVDTVEASRRINSKVTGRGKVSEIVVRNYT